MLKIQISYMVIGSVKILVIDRVAISLPNTGFRRSANVYAILMMQSMMAVMMREEEGGGGTRREEEEGGRCRREASVKSR